ncbi:CpsD/CapB family tyrosine-protein kinase [Pseudalkalibacillus sp. SCS-8]|uniref:CpsD/CapB family tyrosine-protein kinase n=1 Tax=Pseudalkalibacillus nanhaiensis TaxID=3115291 RepID=UPI0032DBC631
MKRKHKKAVREFKERSLITHYNSKSPISEQYRTIRSNIHFSSIDTEYRTLMVTSSGPGEGKSTTTANLAVVMAQQGKRVLLIDADLRKPTAHYTFRVSNAKGLTNVLTRQVNLLDAVSLTEVDRLHILPSGPVPPNPAELLGSRMMQELTKEALDEFDMVIFDTPPVLAVTDAQILANTCDGVVLVVGSGVTEKDAAQKSKELLVAAKAKLLGVVLNRKKMDDKNYYYYYGN